ncbi:Rieske (2Fe-2S) protein [Kitasatospora viridis]|uniref:Cytochrome bc1 complex Rieske iron-sulfur subunit n=1 Tax=Kitasatospora viridis TaxID=281105 RepID=A0A561TVF2_9ACTN|nr:Rieske (2Fe-2S) protein [Kitasatospora viridis]TWF91087.1 nitrite reductase/ring-hydroxylating ferredoxin subunit [Kitasatospora viridis]
MAETSSSTGFPTRRAVVAVAGSTGLAAALAACSGGSDQPAAAPAPTSPAAPPTPPAPSASASASSAPSPVSTSDIPVGGGTVFKEQQVVVTQPTQGEFKAFSAICTHRGCTVADVTGGTINCPCHGSKFKIADGSVANGPATLPLPEAKVTVSGTSIAFG